MPHLYVIAAPSGSGKTTLCHMLLRDFPQIDLSVSTTSRAPRGAETHGKEYFFVSREDFQKEIDSNHFAEWAEVHGNFYGTSKKTIQAAFDQGKSVLLDIDVQGMDLLRKSYPKSCIAIFVMPPSMEILEQRLRDRGTDSEETIQKRLKNARTEISRKDDFDLVIVNDELESAYDKLREFVTRSLESEDA